ncbi:MAG: hypothetical protein KDD94_10610 [Calditrichaeota bacterium]|nr:hypothetical protein [Calditrichota bacterium]
MKHVLALIFILLLASCKQLSYQEELTELLSEDSGNSKELIAGAYRIKATYLPLRYFELRELIAIDSATIDNDRIEAIKERCRKFYGNGIYFKVTLAKADGKDIVYDQMSHFGEWSQQLQKLLFGLKEYIYLETDEIKEIPLSVYDFERSFGYTKDRSMLLVFPKTFNDKSILDGSSSSLAMHFKDWGWNIGRQKLEWEISNLN